MRGTNCQFVEPYTLILSSDKVTEILRNFHLIDIVSQMNIFNANTLKLYCFVTVCY